MTRPRASKGARAGGGRCGSESSPKSAINAAGTTCAAKASRQSCTESAADATSGPHTPPHAIPEAKNFTPVNRWGDGGMRFTSTRPAVKKEAQPIAVTSRPAAKEASVSLVAQTIAPAAKRKLAQRMNQRQPICSTSQRWLKIMPIAVTA